MLPSTTLPRGNTQNQDNMLLQAIAQSLNAGKTAVEAINDLFK